ncbi:MAG TPA: hypothetical protein QGF58_12385 [Myxococcota bacterium]|nr:hypothetical protein [Myxococcota bacterium]
MSFFDYFKSPLPEIVVDEETAARLARSVAETGDPAGAAEALRTLVEEDLSGLGGDFVDQLGVPTEELFMELYLLAWIGFVQAIEDGGASRDDALQTVEPYRLALREYIAFGHRGRYDEGPGPVMAVADRLAVGGRDARHVVLGFLPSRLGVRNRRGAVEGLMRLSVLAQRCGYELGACCS